MGGWGWGVMTWLEVRGVSDRGLHFDSTLSFKNQKQCGLGGVMGGWGWGVMTWLEVRGVSDLGLHFDSTLSFKNQKQCGLGGGMGGWGWGVMTWLEVRGVSDLGWKRGQKFQWGLNSVTVHGQVSCWLLTGIVVFQVRLAASVATRQFLVSLPTEEARQKFYPILIPRMCLNRYAATWN